MSKKSRKQTLEDSMEDTARRIMESQGRPFKDFSGVKYGEYRKYPDEASMLCDILGYLSEKED